VSVAFETLDAVPALVESRDRLLAVLETERPSPGGLIETIEADIALVVEVLRLANRAEPRRPGGVVTIPHALEVLTPDGVEMLARRIAVVDFFEEVPGWEVTPDQLRSHSVTTQRLAAQLVGKEEQDARDELAIAALLHDVGKLVMAVAYPDYAEALAGGIGTPEGRLLTEQATFGIDHAIAGGVLLRRWGLPYRLAAVVASHHDPDSTGAAAMVRLADMYAHYEHEGDIDSHELVKAAARCGVDDELQRSLLHAGPWGRCRPRPIESSPLTKAELVALRGLATGKVYTQIARDLNRSPSTIRSQLRSACLKLGVRDRAQAVLVAKEHRWL
jgi:putative nucleotidyltransferase with HDIG domain